MLGAFLLGLLTQRVRQPHIMVAMGISLVAMIAVNLTTPLAWTWYVLTGTILCATVGWVASYVG
jgi:CBS-domain-containing membrane protein